MAPKRVGTLDPTIRKVLTNGLVTRFGISLEVAKKFLPKVVEQWGKLRRLEGGDIMHAHDIVSRCADGRDVSFIRVRELVFLEMTDFNALPNSMSNLLIETTAIETFPWISSYEHFLGNFATSLSSPFLKATNLKQRSLKLFVSQLFGKFIPTFPMLIRRRRFPTTRRLGPWTPLTSNPSSALSAVLKTGENGGWSTAVVRSRMQYSLRRVDRWRYD